MTNKLCTIALLALSCSSFLIGQSTSFAPLGASWYYRPAEWLPEQNTSLYTFTATKDTLIGGWLGRELSCSVWENGSLVARPELNKYVYANADSVFYLVGNNWELLFDFSAGVGDTVRSKVQNYGVFNGCVNPNPGDEWPFEYKIDSMGVENIGGINLRVQYVTGICLGTIGECWSMGYPGKIVERIGAINAGYWWGVGQTCLFSFPGYLRCYQDGEANYRGDIGNTACDFVGIREIYNGDFSIFPNPTDGLLNLTFSSPNSGLRFRVFDSLGSVYSSGILEDGLPKYEINLEGVPAGILFLHIQSENRSSTYKILKK